MLPEMVSVQRIRRSIFVALLVSTVAVACAVKMATVTGPDGNQWQTCDGSAAKCIEVVGEKCPNGYVLGGHEKRFNCKPDKVDDQGPCATDKELETMDTSGPLAQLHPYGTGGALDEVKHLRGPDCHMWLKCQNFAVSHDPLSSAPACLNLVGEECRNGYIEAEVFGEALYRCRAPHGADQPDANALPNAVAPPDAVAPVSVKASQ
jgi:hypothetical protein